MLAWAAAGLRGEDRRHRALRPCQCHAVGEKGLWELAQGKGNRGGAHQARDLGGVVVQQCRRRDPAAATRQSSGSWVLERSSGS
jgi:hypothetical protein